MKCFVALSVVLAAVASAELPSNPTCTGVLMLGVYKRNGEAGVSNRAVEDKIGAPSALTWGHVSKSSFGCMDGRWQMNSMYTPGSDVGEFILAVNAYEKMTGEKMSAKNVQNLMASYLDKTSKAVFGMCSNKAGADGVEKAIRANANVSSDASMPQMSSEVASTAASDMATEANTGDMFLKALMAKPDEYKTPTETVKNVIKAFYSIMFEGNSVASQKLHTYTLKGENSPVAYVNVKEGKRCNNLGVAPLLKSTGTDGGVQMMFTTEGAVSLFRSELAMFFQEATSKVDAEDMTAKMKEIGSAQLKQYLASFGPLPSFTAELK